jgi:hypothetical protein
MTGATAPLRGPLRKRESNLWAREADDWYVEPEWCSRRLFEEEKFEGTICDPAAGGGNIIRSAAAVGLDTIAFDTVDRGFPLYSMGDFLTSGSCHDNFVCNPPFALAEAFLARALKNSHRKVALLLPANWVQGDKRSRMLAATPLRRVYFITPRPSMPPGHVLAAGDKPGNGTTDYAWFVWLRGYDGSPEVRWLRRDA